MGVVHDTTVVLAAMDVGSTLEAFNAMRQHPDAQPHLARAAALADGFDPIICTVVDTTLTDRRIQGSEGRASRLPDWIAASRTPLVDR